MDTPGEPTVMPSMHRVCTVALGLLLLISPLKLANSVSSHVYSFFPLEPASLVFGPWPISWAPVFCGLTLLLVLITHGVPSVSFFRRTWLIWIAPASGFLTCWIGWIGTSNLLHPIAFSLHMAAMLAFTLALLIHVAYCPKNRRILIMFMIAGIGLLCIQVASEYFWSYKDTLAQLEEVVKKHGSESVNASLMDRLRQNRPQAYFPIPNSLAGHVILVAPFFIALAYHVGRKIDPPEVSQVVLPSIVGGIFIFIVFTTKSRAAAMAMFAALGGLVVMCAVYYHKQLRQHLALRVISVLALPGVIILALCAYMLMRDGRTMSSLDARFIYWTYGWQMFRDNPLHGIGIGEFFHHFIKLKPEGAETARLPHSMLVFFASGWGILGVLSAYTYLFTPIGVLIASMRGKLKVISPVVFLGSLTGLIAWLLHTQVDFNIHIPASLMAVSFCLIMAIDLSELKPAGTSKTFHLAPLIPLVLVALCAVSSVLRSPGDYYLASLEQEINNRQGKQGGLDPIEVLIPLAEKGTTWTPGSFLFWERLGSQAMRERRADIAKLAYGNVVAINPHYAAGHFRYASVLAHLKEFDQARAEFNKGLEWNPYPTEYTELRKVLFGE